MTYYDIDKIATEENKKHLKKALSELEKVKDPHFYGKYSYARVAVNEVRQILDEIERYEKWGWNGKWSCIRVQRFCNEAQLRWGYHGEKLEQDTWLVIEFPTGPYWFGDDYDSEMFGWFFNELKEAGPSHCDDVNRSMLFDEHHARNAVAHFEACEAKYEEIHKKRMKENRMKQIEKELERLKQEVQE